MGINLEVPLEMIDAGISSLNTGVNLLASSYLFLDSDDYDGATYTFEIVASNSHATIDYTVDLYDVTGSAIKATITVPANTTLPKRFRSGSWTPTDATNRTYGVRLAQTASAAQLKVFTARIIVTQVDATKTRIQIPLINNDIKVTSGGSLIVDSTSSTTYEQFTPGKYSYYKKDTSVLSSISNWSLEAVLSCALADKLVYCALFNATDDAQVTGAEVSISGTTPTLVSVDFANAAANFDNGDDFEARIRKVVGGYTVKLYRAALYCRLTSLVKAEIFWRVGRDAQASTAAATYPEGRVLLNTSALSNPTIYLEASAICADNAQIVFLRDHLTNDSGVNGSVVAGSGLNFNSDTKVRIRSGALTLTDDDRFYAYKVASTGSLALSNAWVIVDITGIAPEITKQPVDTTVKEGEEVNISVEATGDPTPEYQWYKSSLQDFYNTGDNGNAGLPNSSNWLAQIFTAGKSYDIYSVRLKLWYFVPKLPGIITASIRNTDGSGNPIGGDLCVGTTNGDTLSTSSPGKWREIVFSSTYPLVKDAVYAIVLRSEGTGGLSGLCWRYNTAGAYTGGGLNTSNNSGVTWQGMAPTNDAMFETHEDYEPLILPGKTNPTLSFTADRADAGAYECRVYNIVDEVWSNLIELTVQYLEIINHPASISKYIGETATFSVNATGIPALSYEWFYGSEILPGETTSELSFIVTAVNGGDYRCRVYNSAGELYSNWATLSIYPEITGQDPDVDITVDEGDPVNLSVTATGTPAPSYQWYFDDGGGYDIIPGETNSTLNFTADRTDAGNYKCRAYNVAGEDWSNPILLIVQYPVEITVQPVNLVVPEGLLATFSVTAVGVPDPTYQWYKDDVILTGETNSTLSFYCDFASEGIYRCKVSN